MVPGQRLLNYARMQQRKERMIEIEGVKFDVPDAVSELLRVVSVERDELKTENDHLRIACTVYRGNSKAWEERYRGIIQKDGEYSD
jgi:hypothetical protein